MHAASRKRKSCHAVASASTSGPDLGERSGWTRLPMGANRVIRPEPENDSERPGFRSLLTYSLRGSINNRVWGQTSTWAVRPCCSIWTVRWLIPPTLLNVPGAGGPNGMKFHLTLYSGFRMDVRLSRPWSTFYRREIILMKFSRCGIMRRHTLKAFSQSQGPLKP